jgi:hypothetical protein
MSKQIKFQKFYVTDGAVKAKVFYSAGQNYRDVKAGIAGGLVDTVTLYARDYDRKLGLIFKDGYQNDTDLMTDYFDQGRVRLFPGDTLYDAALARAKQNDADRAAAQAAKAAKRAFKAANDALDDFNYVGSRHHY